ncbi:hypothetical protein B0O80DRAFT_427679 [Mortierella sp. GBAus27b]|nr:hypothetical protein B0O80DRAFT_427679 [Mortierella sp. GBAus27b]
MVRCDASVRVDLSWAIHYGDGPAADTGVDAGDAAEAGVGVDAVPSVAVDVGPKTGAAGAGVDVYEDTGAGADATSPAGVGVHVGADAVCSALSDGKEHLPSGDGKDLNAKTASLESTAVRDLSTGGLAIYESFQQCDDNMSCRLGGKEVLGQVVYGHIRPGHDDYGISGAGKTSLLDILGGRHKSGIMHGTLGQVDTWCRTTNTNELSGSVCSTSPWPHSHVSDASIGIEPVSSGTSDSSTYSTIEHG